MTDNEMAKLHIRYMVGGHAPRDRRRTGLSRRVSRTPRRPAANFLGKLGGRWNISMFHYRNHGAAYGRVLVGLQVPTRERREVPRFLDSLNYRYQEETGNDAYRFFLS